jgi:hypothetical protein
MHDMAYALEIIGILYLITKPRLKNQVNVEVEGF